MVAAKALTANRRGLDGATLRASVADVTQAGDDDARARLRLAWQVPQFGRFAYTTRAALHRDGDAGWQVVWDPRLVHPALTAATRLGTSVDRPARAPILDRDGRPLVTARAVVRVGVARDRVKDVDATAAAVAKVVDIDAAAYAKAIRNAGPRQFVEAVELRADDFAPKRAGSMRSRACRPSRTPPSSRRRGASPARCSAPSARSRRSSSSGSARPTARARRSGSSASRRATRSSSRGRRRARSSSASPTARRTARCAAGRARRAARCARRSTATSRPRPRPRSATATARPRSSRSDPRRETCSRSPTGPPTPRSTARSAAATRPARRSRSSARPRCCATA